MRKLLNTLYVTSEDTYLARKGETVLVRVAGETKYCIPIHNLDGIICFGRVGCSPPLMGLCGENKVNLSFISINGRFLARVQGPVSGNVLLRRNQYRIADDIEKGVGIARSIVIAKIANSRNILFRAARDRPDSPAVITFRETAERLSRLMDSIADTNDLDKVRGIEGLAGQMYFGVFDNFITAQKKHFHFETRNRRPPKDNINALLSFLYTILTHDVVSALESVGLDPAVGFLHADRPGRPGLALDLMEEFRGYLVDRLALSLINRKQITERGFTITESGAVRMDTDTRKIVITAYQKRKQEEIKHPFLDEKIEIGLLPYAQAMLLARHVRGDMDTYPPFLIK
ncbi:MAG: type I-C CRISPR-associated endonuclease Cas1 [candidate division Zixibacteria bacterium]|nr:type I-C CRISPR-associated endonuclease Cas1 [candidate division Zixibacteria bacterium]